MSMPWKTWLSVPVLGALTCVLPGCQSATEPDESSVSVTEPLPDHQAPVAVATPVRATADLAPRTVPPLDTVKQEASQVVGALDQDLKQAGQTIKAEAAKLPIEMPQAQTPPSPTAPAPLLDTVKKDVNQAVSALGRKSRRTADELKQTVRDKAGVLEHEVTQAAGNLERDVQTQAKALPGTVLQKAEDFGKETLKGLQTRKPPVPPGAK